MQALVETTEYTVIIYTFVRLMDGKKRKDRERERYNNVSIKMQDKRSGLQAHVDEREQGQNIEFYQCSSNQNTKKTKMHSTLILIL